MIDIIHITSEVKKYLEDEELHFPIALYDSYRKLCRVIITGHTMINGHLRYYVKDKETVKPFVSAEEKLQFMIAEDIKSFSQSITWFLHDIVWIGGDEEYAFRTDKFKIFAQQILDKPSQDICRFHNNSIVLDKFLFKDLIDEHVTSFDISTKENRNIFMQKMEIYLLKLFEFTQYLEKYFIENCDVSQLLAPTRFAQHNFELHQS
ncbi:hypothetical protein JHD46_02095 [Sulfurimonas sp. SAG-AH-194-C20]|nr:hypothetical protein [Sulfurimonas sp. SAG-AH-194-C20]MDF1878426.1 hypothetical protein [Sulfurimonas sp. SAG-AH-194-C20]